MDVNSESDFLGHTNDGLATNHLETPGPCGLCGRPISADGEAYICLVETVSICGDCKFLLLEDIGNQVHDSRLRRLQHSRRSTHGDSESSEARLIQHFSQMVNLARHIDHEQEGLHEDDSSNLRLHQPGSSRTTPTGSRRWRRIVSDTESDGFNSDSFYGESESIVSFGGYRVSYGDGVSISSDSDTSVDFHMFLYGDRFVRSVQRSDSDSDSDIDPMRAGAVDWNLDDGEIDDPEWEEVDTEEITTDYVTNEQDDPSISHTSDYPEFEDIMVSWRVGGMSGGGFGNSGDFLNPQGFEGFFEQVGDETNSSRRGAPPASVSYVDRLPLILISEEHQKPDGLACAICKDLMEIGTRAKQLPCLHLYHPSCILPWLSASNTCPLCRYELPTDDIDYERQKLDTRDHSRMGITEIQQGDDVDDSSSVIYYSDASEMDEAQELREMSGNVTGPPSNDGRGRWLSLAAAPVVSLMSVVFVLWLGNSLTRSRLQIGQHNGQRAPRVRSSYSGMHNQRGRRRWWWF